MQSKNTLPVPPAVATSYALGFIVLCLVVYIMNVAATVMVPLVMAVFIWYLINAIARGLGSLSRFGIAIPRMACFGFAIMFLLAGLWMIFELIRENVAQVAAAAPQYQANFNLMLPKVTTFLGLEHIPNLSDLLKQIDLGKTIAYAAAHLANLAGKTVEVLFLTFFLLYEQQFFDHKIKAMVQDKPLEGKIRHILQNIDIKIQRYIWVKTLVSTLAALSTYVILRVVGEDFAAFWGLLAFFLHFIPYVGTFAAIAIPSLVGLAQFGDLGTFLTIVAALSVALMLIGHLLDPRLLGETLNLSPIFIITSLAMWEMIWGVPGMFLAIPNLAILVITLGQFETTRPIAVLLSKNGVIEPGPKRRGGKKDK
ncbi:MAG: AI-2E family transporter [Alphaproteobacteria bacterium]|nr:AI-2E family transporter [Alphaproteobacteria bacterium]